MAALPSIQNFERDLSTMISRKLDDALSGVVDSFTRISKELTGRAASIFDSIKEPFVSIKDAMKINITGRAMDRVRQLAPLPGLRRQDPVETSLNNLSTVTEKGFEETVNSLNKIEEYFKWENEKQKGEDQKPEPAPEEEEKLPEPEKKSFSAMFLGGMKDLIATVFKVFTMILGGAAVAGLVALGFKNLEQNVSDGMKEAFAGGHNEIGGGIKGLLVGVQDDIMSRISAMGRWAAIGATLGIAGGLPGMIAGGLMGAGLGAIAVIIDSVAGEFISNALDSVLDGLATAVETFTGTDTARVSRRIESLQGLQEKLGKELEDIYDKLESLQKDLAKEEAAGNDARANRIRREIKRTKELQASKLEEFDAAQTKIRGFEHELSEAQMGFWEKAGSRMAENNRVQSEAIKDALDWAFGEGTTASIDKSIEDLKTTFVEYIDQSWEMLTKPFKKFWSDTKQVWNDGMNYLDLEIERSKAEWTKAYDDTVTKVVGMADSIGEFFTQTIPDTIGSFIENLKKRLGDAFGYVKELGKVMYEEISVNDFNPFSDGPSYSERISARMAEYESASRIRENSESQNAKAEATFNVITDAADQAMARAVQASVGVQTNQNVTQNSYYDSGISVRDKDPASLRDAAIANGYLSAP